MSSFAQVGIQYRYGQTCKHIEGSPAAVEHSARWNLMDGPQHDCFHLLLRPPVLLHHIILIVLANPKEKCRHALKNVFISNIYIFKFA
jgi:hypothetical protein